MNLVHLFENLRRYCAKNLNRLRFRRPAARLQPSHTSTHAFVIIQIDALGYSVLQAVIEQGNMPHLARLLQQGGYQLSRWHCGLPSTTTAIQAGFFYGSRSAPGFRWYDKTADTPLTSHRPDHMRNLEENLRSAHLGLLEGGGVYTSLLSGDAEHAVFTVSRMLGRQLQGYLEGTGLLLSFLLRPLRVFRLLRYALTRFGRRLWPSLRQFHALHFPLGRAFFEAVMDAMFTEFMTFCVLLDLYRGVPRLYANFNGYDEIAHEYGVLHDEALWVLRWVDSRLAEIERLSRQESGVGYDVFILSDHGMAPAIPFRTHFGLTLGEFVAKGVHLDVGFDAGKGDAAAARALRTRYLITAMRDSQSRLPAWSRRLVRVARRPLLHYVSSEESAYDWRLEGDVVVQASGPLAHVYFRLTPRPMDLPEITLLYAEFMQQLVGHEGIELVAGRDADQVVILGRMGGVLTVSAGSSDVQGRDPLRAFRDRDYVLRELRRLVQLPVSGDLVLLGRLFETGEVITFEEQHATHGGLGGGQDEPFIIFPRSVADSFSEIESPEALYDWFGKHYSKPVSPGPNAPGDNHQYA